MNEWHHLRSIFLNAFQKGGGLLGYSLQDAFIDSRHLMSILLCVAKMLIALP